MRRSILLLILMLLAALLVASTVSAASLCPGPQICPTVGTNVKWVVYQGGFYKYTDGSAEVWGDRDIVYWSRSPGYRLTGLCIQTWRGTTVWQFSPLQEGWYDDHLGPICAVVVRTVPQ